MSEAASLARPMLANSLCRALIAAAVLIVAPSGLSAEPSAAAEERQPAGAAGASPASPPDIATAPPKPKAPTTRRELLDGLYGQLAKAPDAETASTIIAAIEEVWAKSGSPTVDLLLERAIIATEARQTDLAMRLLNAIVELRPDFSEAFTRRAFLYVILDDRRRALGDLRRALALDSNNFRALDGLIQVLKDVGEKKAALEAARQLMKVHPHAEGLRTTIDELARDVEGQGI